MSKTELEKKEEVKLETNYWRDLIILSLILAISFYWIDIQKERKNLIQTDKYLTQINSFKECIKDDKSNNIKSVMFNYEKEGKNFNSILTVKELKDFEQEIITAKNNGYIDNKELKNIQNKYLYKDNKEIAKQNHSNNCIYKKEKDKNGIKQE